MNIGEEDNNCVQKIREYVIERRTTLGEVRDINSTQNNLERCEEVDKETETFLIKNEKYEDLFLKLQNYTNKSPKYYDK